MIIDSVSRGDDEDLAIASDDSRPNWASGVLAGGDNLLLGPTCRERDQRYSDLISLQETLRAGTTASGLQHDSLPSGSLEPLPSNWMRTPASPL